MLKINLFYYFIFGKVMCLSNFSQKIQNNHTPYTF